MKVLPGLFYTQNHEWVKIEGNKAYVGITDYAQEHLGDIVFVEMPVLDDRPEAGDVFSVVESVKAAADIYAPLGGKVIEINEALEDNPGLINESPFEAWIAIMEIGDNPQLEGLFDDESYEAFCAK